MRETGKRSLMTLIKEIKRNIKNGHLIMIGGASESQIFADRIIVDSYSSNAPEAN